jgi:DNA-binding NarL/FixJ family response regulator
MIRVMLVDDHAVVREGYRRLIEKHDGLAVIAEAPDGHTAYSIYKDQRPDVVVLDLSMPGKGGIEVLRRLRQWDGGARVLVSPCMRTPPLPCRRSRRAPRAT